MLHRLRTLLGTSNGLGFLATFVFMACFLAVEWRPVFSLISDLAGLDLFDSSEPASADAHNTLKAISQPLAYFLIGAYLLGLFVRPPRSNVLYHVTAMTDVIAILTCGWLGAGFGIFALTSLPSSLIVRALLTLKFLRPLDGHVLISGEAVLAFQPPPPIGPFTMARRLLGVVNSPPGSVWLWYGNLFVPDFIRRGGDFRWTDGGDQRDFRWHQFTLDYVFDLAVWFFILFVNVFYWLG